MPKLSNVRLTDTFVRSLKPREQRYEVFDSQLPGFGLRVAAGGTKSWIALGRVHGRRKRVTLGTYPLISLARARDAAAAALGQMRDGTLSEEDPRIGFEAAVNLWYEKEQRYRKSFKQVHGAMALHVLPHLGKMELKQIRKVDLLRIIDRLADDGKTTQANRVRAFLSRFFNWACERDFIDTSPAAHLPKRRHESSRDRVLSGSELAEVWQAARRMGYPFGAVVQLLIITGQRRDEVAAMTWSEVDFDARRWTIAKERSKNGQAHTVYLSDLALTLLSSLPRRDGCDLVFSTTGKTPVSGFSRAKQQLDKSSSVSDWRLHDLRRTMATRMADTLRVQPAVIDRIINHKSGVVRGVAAVYQRSEYLKEREDALVAWSLYVGGLAAAHNFE